MSRMLSSTPPTPSHGAPSDQRASNERAYLDAASQIESFGLFGLIWLDDGLIVRRVYGRIVAFVETGAPVTETLLPLIGLEAEILALRDGPLRTLELPAVSIATADGKAEKLNLTFFWSPLQSTIVALAHRSNAQTELELELSRQIRARLMAEAESAAKSRDLARANADLESFAAIISHDLKAPLRHMQHLADKAGEGIGGEAAGIKEALDRIGAQAERMSRMLSRLFEYSSLGRKYEALEMVDAAELIGGIVESLPASNIAITIEGEWPTLATLRAPLDLVLRNLISNARQHHDREAGLICVACADSQDALVITVTDDGPGIAREHHGAIFLPFRTLADPTGSTSTGMGLAMINRTMEAVGGAVTISSDPAARRGAIFAIQWPKIIGPE